MSVFGIVCETNPIHNGHVRLITAAKAQGAEAIVCVMSGNTVQRGEFAIADKYLRAEALLRCGADLVIELPYPWCSGSAEYFAKASISILRQFCDTVIFGSECGDIELLRRSADVAAEYSFREEFLSGLKEGLPAAKLYFEMLKRHVGRRFGSNDLLGVEYIKTSNKLGFDLEFITISRKGDDYNSKKIDNMDFPSAMAIRNQWENKNIENIESYMPKEARRLYIDAINSGKITDSALLDSVWLSFFRLHRGDDFQDIPGAFGGIANRICDMSHKARSADELMGLVSNKRYTDASLKRVMLYCLTGVTRDDLEEVPRETLLLAANERGRELIAKKRKENGLRVVTKPADLDMDLRQNILMQRVDSVFTLARSEKLRSDEYIKRRPFIK